MVNHDPVIGLTDAVRATEVTDQMHRLFLELVGDPKGPKYSIDVSFGDGLVSVERIGTACVLQGGVALKDSGVELEVAIAVLRAAYGLPRKWERKL
jgi:hypothetical protein